MSTKDTNGELVATVSFTREQAKDVIEDMELGELTDEQWDVIVKSFPDFWDGFSEAFDELVEDVCSRKHPDTPKWMEGGE
jgi:sulfur relay (sulfurtransferase) DsrC/TusE family protein